MNENNQIDDIKHRLKTNAYFTNPHSDAHAANDLQALLQVIETQQKKVEQLEKKNEVLAQHVLELTQEMENTKSDFGNSR